MMTDFARPNVPGAGRAAARARNSSGNSKPIPVSPPTWSSCRRSRRAASRKSSHPGPLLEECVTVRPPDVPVPSVLRVVRPVVPSQPAKLLINVLLQLRQRAVQPVELFLTHRRPEGKERPARERRAPQGALELADTQAVVVG